MTEHTPITLDDAKNLLVIGEWYGSVYPFVDEADRDELARYFCTLARNERQSRVRAELAKFPVPSTNGHKPVPTDSGTSHICPRCGALMVVARACVTCQVCKHSEGCAG